MRHFPRRYRRLISIFLAAALVLSISIPFSTIPEQALAADNDTPVDNTWITDGTVNDIVTDGTTTYLGGSFTAVGPYQGGGAPYDPSTNQPFGTISKVNGSVLVAEPDDAGGWYIGGSFTRVGNLARNNIAHIFSSGVVDANWNPNANNDVYTIELSGGIVYVSGDFTSIGGASRTRAAALNSSGTATSWVASLNARAYKILVEGSAVYLGGAFTTVNGTTRNRIAKVDTATGALDLAWNPNVGPAGTDVYDLEISGSLLYLVGSFGTVSAVTRLRIAAVDKVTAALDSFAPTSNIIVREIDIYGGFAYFCGDFQNINGNTTFNALARTDLSGVLDTTWDPVIGSSCHDIEVVGTDIYAGGVFVSLGGSTRNRIGAVSIASATLHSWAPWADDSVEAITVSGSNVYIGGLQTSVAFQARNRVAAFNVSTGAALAFNPNVNASSVQALELAGGNLYICGNFSQIGGTARNNIGRVNATTGLLDLTWNPNLNNNCLDVMAVGSDIYLAGQFTTVNAGPTRNRLAKVNNTTGTVDGSFNPNAGNIVNSIDLDNGKIYAGGTFTTMGGVARNRLAAVDTITGALDTLWNPNAGAAVEDLDADSSNVFVVGSFTSVGGQTRNRIAQLDQTTGAATTWNPSSNGAINEILVTPVYVFVGGNFTTIGGQSRTDSAQLSRATGLATSWNPQNAVSGVGVEAIAITPNGNHVYVGGPFTQLNGGGSADDGRNFFAEYAFDAPPESEIITIDGTVPRDITLTISDNTIGFGSLSPSSSRYATGDGNGLGTPTVAHTLAVTTNAATGYSLMVFGPSLSNGVDTITAIGGTATAPVAGTQQFGLRVTAAGGSGTASSPYNGANYAYAGVAAPSQIAASSSSSLQTTYSIYYVVNIDTALSTGEYETQLLYICAPRF